MAEQDLNSLTVPVLKKLLGERGLSQKGKKNELIARLQEVNVTLFGGGGGSQRRLFRYIFFLSFLSPLLSLSLSHTHTHTHTHIHTHTLSLYLIYLNLNTSTITPFLSPLLSLYLLTRTFHQSIFSPSLSLLSFPYSLLPYVGSC